MCSVIEFSRFEFSEPELAGLRINGDEVRVAFMDKTAFLPIHIGGRNKLILWGNKVRSLGIPCTGFCRKESITTGVWNWIGPRFVDIIVNRACANGTWFQVRRGIKGVLVYDESGVEHVYVMTEPATHYYKTMTGANRMPVLIGQVI